MAIIQKPTGLTTLEQGQENVKWLFDKFSMLSLSFSGGKDSSTVFILMADECRNRNKRIAHQLFPDLVTTSEPEYVGEEYIPNDKISPIDHTWLLRLSPQQLEQLQAAPGYRKFSVFTLQWEAQYSKTVEHIIASIERYLDCCEPWVIAIPTSTYNTHSTVENHEFISYDILEKEVWIEQPLRSEYFKIVDHKVAQISIGEDGKVAKPHPKTSGDGSSIFPWYSLNDPFETTVPRFQEWASKGGLVLLYPKPWNTKDGIPAKFEFCSVTGLKSCESLDRWRSYAAGVPQPPYEDPMGPKTRKKLVPENKIWLTSILPEGMTPKQLEEAYFSENPNGTQDTLADTIKSWQSSPIWDWKPEEDWKFFSQWAIPQINSWNDAIKKDKREFPKEKMSDKEMTVNIWHALHQKIRDQGYTPVYDLFYAAGLTMHQMRIDEPLGSAGSRGLKLYQVLEPHMWEKMCRRIAGISAGVLWEEDSKARMGTQKDLVKPAHLTWRQYLEFMLGIQPLKGREHYKNKMAVYLWYVLEHSPLIDRDFEPESWKADGSAKDWGSLIPDECDDDVFGEGNRASWRKMCYTVLKGDYWCRWLGFSPVPKGGEHGYWKLQMRRRLWWDIFAPEEPLVRAVFQGESEENIQQVLLHPGKGLTDATEGKDSPGSWRPVFKVREGGRNRTV